MCHLVLIIVLFRVFSETALWTMSIEGTGSYDREPVSPGGILWRYSIGGRHPVVEARAVPEGQPGNASMVSGSRHTGEFQRALLTGGLASLL